MGRDDVDDTRRDSCAFGELSYTTKVSVLTSSEGMSMVLTSASASDEKGVSGGGLMTVVQPAASAAPILRVIMAEGKFHGVRIELIQSLV